MEGEKGEEGRQGVRKRAETCVVMVSSLLSQVEQVKSSLQGRQEAAKVSMQILSYACIHTNANSHTYVCTYLMHASCSTYV